MGATCGGCLNGSQSSLGTPTDIEGHDGCSFCIKDPTETWAEHETLSTKRKPDQFGDGTEAEPWQEFGQDRHVGSGSGDAVSPQENPVNKGAEQKTATTLEDRRKDEVSQTPPDEHALPLDLPPAERSKDRHSTGCESVGSHAMPGKSAGVRQFIKNLTTRSEKTSSAQLNEVTAGSAGSKPKRNSKRSGSKFLEAAIGVGSASLGASRLAASPGSASSSTATKRSTGNVNVPQDYAWIESTIECLVRNQASLLTCKDETTGKAFNPMFFVLGACPNLFCAMQAVMYSVSGDGEVDFWWVKPAKDGGLEQDTLCRHAKGPFKNDPGRSKQFYKPLADFFVHGGVKVGDMQFGIEKVGAQTAARAFLEPKAGVKDDRLYIHMVWQEDWTTNPFARSKFIKGKIVYQKDPDTMEFFARQYCILNGDINISDLEESPFTSLLPREDIKDLVDDGVT